MKITPFINYKFTPVTFKSNSFNSQRNNDNRTQTANNTKYQIDTFRKEALKDTFTRQNTPKIATANDELFDSLYSRIFLY